MKDLVSRKKRAPILFLTNNENTNPLYQWICSQGENVMKSDSVLTCADIKKLQPSFILSFNYRYILPVEVLNMLDGRIVNVHCSLLPHNKGASPNFFSYYFNTPKGVTIHNMSPQLDGGMIILNKELLLGEDETFLSSYAKLIESASELIKDNWDQLINGSLEAYPQKAGGSYHTIAEFNSIREKYPFAWDDSICDWKRKYCLA